MIEDKNTLKGKLIDAVRMTFSGCVSCEDYTRAADTVVEFFCAIGLDDADYVDILNACSGMDAYTDYILNELIEEFSTE